MCIRDSINITMCWISVNNVQPNLPMKHVQTGRVSSKQLHQTDHVQKLLVTKPTRTSQQPGSCQVHPEHFTKLFLKECGQKCSKETKGWCIGSTNVRPLPNVQECVAWPWKPQHWLHNCAAVLDWQFAGLPHTSIQKKCAWLTSRSAESTGFTIALQC